MLYTHGPGIDHPLSITRLEYSDSLPGPITIYPHENWKGAFDLGSYDAGSLNAPCKIVGYRNGTHTEFQTWVPGSGETSTPPDTLYNCLKVDWPAPHLWLTNRIRENNQVGAESWNGSLIDAMRDATGQMYMRNRCYDPASGRFTQEDPMGIAGGLNLYGFAAGDPVGYADPLGLKVCARTQALRQAVSNAVHARITWDRDGCVSDPTKITVYRSPRGEISRPSFLLR
ncbi:MAG TPA: RHS repeat-associated core domain-containing protein [Chloroflexota bacterium]|nr:RHS repeat-associated core domain-containing protein [Chloroflexota bacterium]